jgi:hypothetical protein
MFSTASKLEIGFVDNEKKTGPQETKGGSQYILVVVDIFGAFASDQGCITQQ